MATDPTIVTNNVKQLVAKGAPEADIDAYMKSEGYNSPEEFKAANASYGTKVLKDIGQTAFGITPIGGFQLGKTLAQAITPQGTEIPFEMVKGFGVDITKLPHEPTTVQKLTEIGKAISQPYIHPIESLKAGRISSTALAWAPIGLGLKALVKGIPTKIPISTLTSEVQPKTVSVAKLIGGKLEHSTVQNVAQNPYVQKGMSMFAAEDIDNVVNDAAKSTLNAREKISNAQNYIYQKQGITDEMSMPINKVNEGLSNIKTEIDKFSKLAIGENKKIAGVANALYNDLESLHKETPLNFGQLKSVTRQVYDIADSNITEQGRFTEAGKLFNKIGAELTKTKKSVLPVAESSEQYVKLMEAENILRDTLRLDRINGEQTLPLKIIRRFKDAEHGAFKEQLEKVNNIFKENADIFKENPETSDLINEHGNADFVDKIKLTQALHDVTTKRAVTPVGVGRIPILAYMLRATKLNDPLSQMVALKKGIQAGIISPEAITKEISVPSAIIGGRTLAKTRALGTILKTPQIPKQVIPLSAISALSRRREE